MVFKASPSRPGGNRFWVSRAPGPPCLWRLESSLGECCTAIWRDAWVKTRSAQGGIGGSCTGDLRTSSSRRDVSDEGANSEREGGRPTAPGILGGDALLDLPLLLQSRGSSPFSNRSASSSSSPTNPGGLPPLLHPRAPGSSPMCPPPPSCRHPFLELHHRDTGTSSSPLPSLCSVAFAYA